jgi:hypothetical protein
VTAPGGPGAAAVVARRCAGGVRAGVCASAGSGVAPGGRATTAVTVVNRSGRGRDSCRFDELKELSPDRSTFRRGVHSGNATPADASS